MKNLYPILNRHALKTEEKTMCTLPHTVISTLLRESAKYFLRFLA
jgi:hypothetical protein